MLPLDKEMLELVRWSHSGFSPCKDSVVFGKHSSIAELPFLTLRMTECDAVDRLKLLAVSIQPKNSEKKEKCSQSHKTFE